MGWVLSDAELRAVPIAGPLQDLEDAFRKVTAESHGMVCDHHLNVRNYARFSGARLVSFATRNRFPAILCTRYNGSDIDVIRPLLPDIPVVLRPDEINEPDEVHRAFRDCKAELDGKVSPERKAWRAQIVIERIDHERKAVDLAVPAWTLDESIRLRFEDIPAAVRSRYRRRVSNPRLRQSGRGVAGCSLRDVESAWLSSWYWTSATVPPPCSTKIQQQSWSTQDRALRFWSFSRKLGLPTFEPCSFPMRMPIISRGWWRCWHSRISGSMPFG